MDLSSRLSGLRALADQAALTGTQVGLEKEGLRVAQKGGVAMTAHPASLGSPLTNPWITTDYSEALLELITPPCEGNHAAIEFLHQLHCFLHQHLGEEILWTSSMPCILAGEENIPIAEYGNSNAGKMKRIYRVGLGYRYGKTMQVIAGIHYNFSFPAEFWAVYQRVLKDSRDQRAFIDDAYMGMIRNIQRIGWMITYLFGASPAVCKSFFSEMPNMPEFDDSTYFEPWATSLRTGDIGYQNSQETGMGVQISYDNLDTYVAGLADAISTPAPLWERIGVKVNGDYRQLNANILQIENEYYSSIRPKQPPIGMEKPLRALQRRGIQYVELRSLDINPYLPTGLDEEQLNFLEVFMFY
ncbi:MAG: glutamate--cysteine ligase, partial [bacterium]